MFIVTYKGVKEKKENCRFIDGKYYKIGDPKVLNSGECYKIMNKNGEYKYVKENSKLICYDFTKNTYNYISIISSTSGYSSGVGKINEDGSVEYGYFKPDVTKLVYICPKEKYSEISTFPIFNVGSLAVPVKDYSVIDGTSYCLLEPNCGVYYTKEIYGIVTKAKFNKIIEGMRTENKRYNTFNANNYNMDVSSSVVKSLEKQTSDYVSKNIVVKKRHQYLKNILGDFTFGLEFESNGGMIPEFKCYEMGLLPLRDGSIKGFEYATTVNKGVEGLELLKTICDNMSNNLSCNKYTSMHIHFGNVKKTKKEIITLFKLIYRIQDELSSIVPPYKKDVGFLASKSGGAKDHCKPLPNLNFPDPRVIKNKTQWLNICYEKFETFLNDGRKPCSEYNTKTGIHPKEGSNKWNIGSRYYNYNFFNLFFKRGASTLESRLHHGTFNKYKTINWFMLQIAILRFAENNQDLILDNTSKILLSDVIDVFRSYGKEGEELSSYLNSYVESRKEIFFNHLMMNDMNSKTEFSKDSDYIFSHKNISSLF